MIDSVLERAGLLGTDLRAARRRRQHPPIAMSIDRLPPHSPESEQGILGCILLCPKECLSICIPRIRAATETFYDLRHQTIYDMMLAMYDRREEIDIITLQQCLKDVNALDQVGGIPYLNTLQDAVPSASNITYYLDHVCEKAEMRAFIQTCTNAVGNLYDYTGEDYREIFDQHQRDLDRIVRPKSKDVAIKEAVKSALQELEDIVGGVSAKGLPTGFADLDALTCGLHAGDFIIIAARPSVGKTACAMNIVEHLAVTHKVPVGVFSLEMTTEALTMRMLCARARVDGHAIRGWRITASDCEKLALAAAPIAAAPLYLDDTGGLTLSEIKAKARRWHQQHGIKLLVVDYLQLINDPSRSRGDNRQNEITRISGGLKALAKELKIPVLVLSQLNRDLEKGSGKKSTARKPRISDLRESGSLEQDADVVGLMYRPEEADEEEPGTPYEVILHLAKSRNGPRFVNVHLTYIPSHTRFESVSRVSSEDCP